jgi:hypothetical protein
MIQRSKYLSLCSWSVIASCEHSIPDIANAVRELANCMDGASPAAFKEMKRLVKFVIDTKSYSLKMYPCKDMSKQKLELVPYTNSDLAGDRTTRKSAMGYLVFLMGAIILWKSKIQRTVALSSSEAEYYALSEAAKEITFVVQLLQDIEVTVELPVINYCDNVGAIFMAENAPATMRTKHVDARCHFVREYIVDEFVKVVFDKCGDN